MTNAVAAAHYFGFALVLAFLKSGLGHLSSVQSVELKSLLVHNVSVVIQLFYREDSLCIFFCLRKNFSFLRSIFLQASN